MGHCRARSHARLTGEPFNCPCGLPASPIDRNRPAPYTARANGRDRLWARLVPFPQGAAEPPEHRRR